MPAGFTSYRDGGFIQVDDNYQTLTLSAKQTAFISTTNSMSDVRFHSIGINAPYGFVACRTEVLHSALYSAHKSGNSMSFTFMFTTLDASASETVTFYLFEPPVLLADNFGVEVYNGSAQLCFTDQTNPVRVRAVNAAGDGYSGAGGRIFAPIILQRGDRSLDHNGVLWNIETWFYRCIGSQIVPQRLTWRRHSNPVTSVGSYLAADVTGY